MKTNKRRLWAASLLGGLVLWAADRGAPVDAPASPDGVRVEHRIGPRSTGPVDLGAASLREATLLAAPQELSAWRADELWLAARGAVDVEQVARDHGLTLRRAPGASGLSPVSLPAGGSLVEVERALREDPRVARVQRVGQIIGASQGNHAPTQLSDLQWHLEQIGMPSAERDLSGLVVAVLDSGAAFEDYDGHLAASGLAGVDVVAPYDFVNGDPHPEDEHLHGTHISNLILAQGELPGVASGASLMPLRVLDEDNSGSEADLVDALHWAVDNGADLINLSLVFPAGYSPSEELEGALEYAHDAGVVMIGAAGNDGDARALYPAASPLVLSVAASQVRNPSGRQLDLTAYSNAGGTVDLLAPGGDLSRDADHDGYPDGLLAEGPPTAGGAPTYYLYAGTSQATALASGAALHLMAEGVREPAAVAHALQLGGDGALDDGALVDGEGANELDIEGAVAAIRAEQGHDCDVTVYGMVMPYLAEAGRYGARPRAWVSVVDEDGLPVEQGERVLVSAWGPEGFERLDCRYDSELGGCEVELDRVDLVDAQGAALEAGWGFSVDGLVLQQDQQVARPRRGVFVSGGLVVLTEALDADGLLDDALLGLRWGGTEDALLGDLSPAYALLDLGVGAASRPSGLLLTEGLMQALGQPEEVEVDLDGSGLVTEPLGLMTASRVTLDGSGLVTEPLGFTGYNLLFIEGSGLITEPLGFHGLDLFSFEGSGLVTEPLGIRSDLLRLDEGSFLSVDHSDTALGGIMADGGLLAGQGEQGPAWFNASGVLLSGVELGVEADIAGYQRRALVVDASVFEGLQGGAPRQQTSQTRSLPSKGARLR